MQSISKTNTGDSELHPLPKSLLLPVLSLMAHAAEHRRPQGILRDFTAQAWFEALASVYSGIPNMEPELINGIITRSIIIDYILLDYINTNKPILVTDLGCGFSTRLYRLKPMVAGWVNMDLAKVLRIRRSFQPLAEIENLIACDLSRGFKHTEAWPNPFNAELVFIAEGLLNHLERDEARDLTQSLCKIAPGQRLIGTVMTARAADGLQTLSEALGTPLPAWGVESYSELVKWLKPAHMERCSLLGKVSSRLGLVRPADSDEASGLVFEAKL